MKMVEQLIDFIQSAVIYNTKYDKTISNRKFSTYHFTSGTITVCSQIHDFEEMIPETGKVWVHVKESPNGPTKTYEVSDDICDVFAVAHAIRLRYIEEDSNEYEKHKEEELIQLSSILSRINHKEVVWNY